MQTSISELSVHIILASFNGERYIQSQIESILNQSHEKFTLEVWDDASSDATSEIVARLAVEDPRVSYSIRRKPCGSAAANFLSACLQTSAESADFFAFADQDDIWFPNKLSRALLMLQSNDADAYSSAVRAIWEDGTSAELCQNGNLKAFDFLFEGAGQGCTFLFSRVLFDELKTILKKYPTECFAVHYHDWLLYLVARTGGKQWFFDDLPTMYYRQHRSNDTGAKYSLSGILGRLRKLESGWYAGQVAKYSAIHLAVSEDAPTISQIILEPVSLSRTNKLFWPILTKSRRRFSERILLLIFLCTGRL